MTSHTDLAAQARAEADALSFALSRYPSIVGTAALLRQLADALERQADVPEGCTPADAQMLRRANHALAEENQRLRLALESKAEPVAWQVRRTDGSPLAVWENCTRDLYDETLRTGRYAGYENGPPCEVRALAVLAAPTQPEKRAKKT